MDIGVFTTRHLPALRELSLSFRWPHTVDDLAFALRTGRGYAALERGELIGSCFTWQFGDSVASLGLLLVRQDRQGQGLGRVLFRHAMKELSGRSVLLHATRMAASLYESEGFAVCGEVRQFHGVVASNGQPSGRCSTFDPDHEALADALSQADLGAVGYDRCSVLGPAIESGSLNVLGDAQTPAAIAVTRPFGRGSVIGPVLARTCEDAERLISDVALAHQGSFVRVDITDAFADTEWLNRLGLQEVDHVIAMANAPLPEGTGKLHRYALIGHAYG
ncbi:MAG: GNAT family N-acetyltransferase [Pseudomonadota bacterium]